MVLMTAVSGFPTTGQAQDASGFRLEALNGICGDVRTGNSNRWEAKVYAAAGVSPSDPPEQIQVRVRALFDQHMPHCDGFDVRRGNLLKYAINQGTTAFIYTATWVWRIDLNQVDVSDGKTVLDYAYAGIQRWRGTPEESLYQNYFDELSRGGAKTRVQLEAEGRRFPGIPMPAQ
ncbi:hypothetical protein [Brevundimonas sp.]|uniref:hypothetical protein n=1 Tax=Brevundimonas sp. TaxID=1871086 RepID=UPI002607E03E|nr:hypothetical protein [Brevundimonas sp.]